MKPELINCLKSYKKSYLFSDIMAGLTVAVIALPLSIALGIQAGLSLQAGIITSIIAGLVMSLLGGCRYTIGSSTTAFVLVVLGYTLSIGLVGVWIATIISGIVIIIASFFGAGKAIRYISYPIVTGFTAGVGLSLFTNQLKDFFGFSIPSGASASFLGKLYAYIQSFSTFNLFSLILGIIAFLIVVFLPKINSKIPTSIVAIVFAIFANMIISFAFGSGAPTIGSMYGDVKAEFNLLDFGSIASISATELIAPVIMFSFLGAIETLLSATVADGMTNTAHDSNQELFAHGIANITAGFFGGFPTTGAIARTSANINYGAKTSLAGLFHSLFLVVMYIALMPLIKLIPLSVLAAIIMGVALKMSNFRLFYRVVSFSIRDCIVCVIAFLLTVIFGLTYGVVSGIALSVLVNIQNFKNPLKYEFESFDTVEHSEKFKSSNRVCYKIEGAVYFASVNKLKNLVLELTKDYDEIVLDMKGIYRIDITSVEKLAKLSRQLAKNEKRLTLHSLNNRVKVRYIKAFEYIVRIFN